MTEEITQEQADGQEVTFEERFAALEHQCYLMYLQLNAVTQLLVDKSALAREDVGNLMDKMHGEITTAVDKLADTVASSSDAPAAE